MDYKKTNAARTTISRDIDELSQHVGGNVYELISILKQRSNQIGVEIKEELLAKLDEFATPSDTLEEVFENQEQTEISRFYDRLPKPTLIAIQEILEDSITFNIYDLYNILSQIFKIIQIEIITIFI